MMSTFGLPFALGVIVIGVFVASFAGTTMDSATRIQRYVLNELAQDFNIRPLMNRYVATAFAIVTAGALAFGTGADGTGALTLWPMFGAVNQLLASLALLVVTLYLRRRLRFGWLTTALPLLFMLAMTHHAMILNEVGFIEQGKTHLAVINALVHLLAVWMTVEGIGAILGWTQPEIVGETEGQAEP
jgi:carbon starvation protein